MSNMFGLPNIPVRDEDNASHVPSQYSNNIMISYPTEQDWRNLYDRLIVHDFSLFTDMRRSHQRSVSKQLDIINSKTVGRAVLSELRAAAQEVLIYPYDFQDLVDWRMNTPTFRTLGITKSYDPSHSHRRGVPLCGKDQVSHQAVCYAAEGGGAWTHIFFTASRVTGTETPDEVLLHELVHAARYTRGLIFNFPMSGGYKNEEEFLAQTVTNIYRSEKGRRPLNYGGAPMDNPNAFLDSDLSPPPATVIGNLRNNPALWAQLVDLHTRFNPVRQVDLTSKAYIEKIEREN